jgi:pyruvate formate lyase activating enzyme
VSDDSSAKPAHGSMPRAERHGSPARPPRRLRIGGLTPLSSTDYPGQLAAVVFCQGCPWRCGYCHNPHLLPARGAVEIAWDDVLAFLRRREGLLDAVVFSGGEPLSQVGLAEALRTVRSMRFRVGLHTGGAYPLRLAEVLPILDWVGFDIKAPFTEYASVTGVPGSGEKARASARLVVESGVAHEFRTTVHPELLTTAALGRLAEQVTDLGARNYVLQEFRARGCASAPLARSTASHLTESFCAGLALKFESFALRRA